MARKTFSSNHKDRPSGPTIVDLDGDILNGKGEPTGERWQDSFLCHNTMPAGALDDVSRSVVTDPRTGAQKTNGASVISFLSQVFVPEDSERFVTLTHDPFKVVDYEKLGEVTQWVVEQLTGDPTPG